MLLYSAIAGVHHRCSDAPVSNIPDFPMRPYCLSLVIVTMSCRTRRPAVAAKQHSHVPCSSAHQCCTIYGCSRDVQISSTYTPVQSLPPPLSYNQPLSCFTAAQGLTPAPHHHHDTPLPSSPRHATPPTPASPFLPYPNTSSHCAPHAFSQPHAAPPRLPAAPQHPALA